MVGFFERLSEVSSLLHENGLGLREGYPRISFFHPGWFVFPPTAREKSEAWARRELVEVKALGVYTTRREPQES